MTINTINSFFRESIGCVKVDTSEDMQMQTKLKFHDMQSAPYRNCEQLLTLLITLLTVQRKGILYSFLVQKVKHAHFRARKGAHIKICTRDRNKTQHRI